MEDDRQASAGRDGASPFARRAFLKGSLVIGAAAGAAAGGVRALAQAPTIESFEDAEPQCRVIVEAAEPNYGLDDALQADFIKLSEGLTGVSPLDRNLGRLYLERYAYHPALSILLPPLIAAFREVAPKQPRYTESDTAIQRDWHPDDSHITKMLKEHPDVQPAAEQLVYLWYISAFFLPVNGKGAWIYGTPEQYETSLLWSLIRAHPPMTHGGPYGYWADAPSS